MRRNQAICRRQAATQASLKLWQALSYFAMTPLAALNQSALCSPVAQQVEQAAVNRWVAGSNPARGATFFKELVEYSEDALTPENRNGNLPGNILPVSRRRPQDALEGPNETAMAPPLEAQKT